MRNTHLPVLLLAALSAACDPKEPSSTNSDDIDNPNETDTIDETDEPPVTSTDCVLDESTLDACTLAP